MQARVKGMQRTGSWAASFPLYGRNEGMGRAMLLLATTMVLLSLTACGGRSAQEEAKAFPLPQEEQELRPGEYRSEEFEPSLSFKVGEGWTNLPPEVYDSLRITRGQDIGEMGFANLQGATFYKPTRTGTPYALDVPEDIVGWLERHPYLETSEPEMVKVGGVKGVQLDLVVENLPDDYSGMCGSDCVDIFRLSTGFPVVLSEEGKVRLIVLEDVKGETVIVGFGGPATEFDEHTPESQKVIDTVKWRGS